jgi:hypothetical protein
MMKRDNAISHAVNDHHWNRIDTCDVLRAFVFVGNGPAQRDLEWPGEPEATEFFPGNGSEAGEGAVEDDAIQGWLFFPFDPFTRKSCA